MGAAGSTVAWAVVTHRDAAPTLAGTLLEEARSTATHGATDHDAVGPDQLRAAAAELIRSTTDLLKNNAGAFGTVGREQPERLARWKQHLRALYELVREDAHER